MAAFQCQGPSAFPCQGPSSLCRKLMRATSLQLSLVRKPWARRDRRRRSTAMCDFREQLAGPPPPCFLPGLPRHRSNLLPWPPLLRPSGCCDSPSSGHTSGHAHGPGSRSIQHGCCHSRHGHSPCRQFVQHGCPCASARGGADVQCSLKSIWVKKLLHVDF